MIIFGVHNENDAASKVCNLQMSRFLEFFFPNLFFREGSC